MLPHQCGCSLGLHAVQAGVAVIKAKQVVPEYEDIEAIQDALAATLSAEWAALAEAGIKAAEAHLASKATVTTAHLNQAAAKLKAPFKAWPSKPTMEVMNVSIEEMYKLSQNVILNKVLGTAGYGKELVFKATGGIEATFNVVDEAAVKSLQDHQLFWVGDYYDEDIREAIDLAAGEELAGLSGQAAGETLRKEAEKSFGVGEFSHKSDWYFAGVAVNAATTARVNGAINEMDEIGIVTYVIVNPMDERTTDICSDLNGKEFPVKLAAKQIMDIQDADDPDDVKEIHPWNPGGYKTDFKAGGVSVTAGKPITPDAATALSQLGYGMPPYHFKCRTTVDVGQGEETGPIPGSALAPPPSPPFDPAAVDFYSTLGGLESGGKIAVNGDILTVDYLRNPGTPKMIVYGKNDAGNIIGVKVKSGVKGTIVNADGATISKLKELTLISKKPPTAAQLKAAKAKAAKLKPVPLTEALAVQHQEIAVDKWVRSLTNAERQAFDEWSGSAYHSMRLLQAGAELPQGTSAAMKAVYEQYNKDVIKAMARAPKSGATVHRGLTLTEKQADALVEGAIMDMKATSSWSSELDVAEHFASARDEAKRQVVLEVKGARGVDISSISAFEEEAEQMMAAGKYRVASREVTVNTTTLRATIRLKLELME